MSSDSNIEQNKYNQFMPLAYFGRQARVNLVELSNKELANLLDFHDKLIMKKKINRSMC
jgi:hypothetical protein